MYRTVYWRYNDRSMWVCAGDYTAEAADVRRAQLAALGREVRTMPAAVFDGR